MRTPILVTAILLAGCVGGLDVVVEQTSAPAGARKFFIIPGLDEAKAGRSSSLASDFIYGRLDAILARTLSERGFDRVLDSQRADLVVRYSVFAREWTRLKAIPPPPMSMPPAGWDRLDGNYNEVYSEIRVEDHREGTLLVDVIDVREGKLAHRFYVAGALTNNAADNLERAEKAIREGLERFGAAP